MIMAAGVLILGLAPLVGMNFFPDAEKPVFLVRVNTPEGTSIERTMAKAIEVERMLLAEDDVRAVTVNVGDGNPVMYYNHRPARTASNVAEIVVTVRRDRKDLTPALARRVRERFADHPDMVVESKVLRQGPPVGLPVSIEIKGRDLARLRAHADQLEAELRQIPGAINVTHDLRPGPPRLDLRIDPVKAGKLGVSKEDVAREVRIALAGAEATILRAGDEDHAVMVRVAREGAEDIRDLDRLRLPLPGGEPVPLRQLIEPKLSPTYAQIHHADLERAVIVGSDVDGRLATEIVSELLPAVRRLELGPEESWRVIGEDEERDRAFLSMLQNVLVALALIYGILVLQFRSFQLPLVIFTSIPVALGGSVLGLLVGGWPFGFTAFIGLLALTGIVVNNAIVLVDQINRLRDEGHDLIEALYEGSMSRLQPIVLTTLTTISGLLPLTLSGDSMWGPMGWVIIGGLVASTGVTLLLVPALYLIIERRGESRAAARATTPVNASTAIPLVLLAVAIGVSLGGEAHASDIDSTTAPRHRNFETELAEQIDLQQALFLALENNPDLGSLRWQVEGAASTTDEAPASWSPSLSLGGELYRTNDAADNFAAALITGRNPLEGGLNEDLNTLQGSVGLRWLLWDFGRGPRIEAARQAQDAADRRLSASSLDVQVRVAQGYFAVVQLSQEIEVQRAALALVERQAQDARIRANAGRGLESDALGLEARAAQIRADLSLSQGRLRRAQALFAEVLGLPAGLELRPNPNAQVLQSTSPNLDALIESARTRRPEIVQARAELAAAEALLAASNVARLPRVLAGASYSGLAPDLEFGSNGDTYRLSLGVQWSLFEGGAMEARQRRAQADARAAEYQVQSAQRSAERRAVEAWTTRETAREQLEAARLQLDAADEAYRIVQLRFEQGRDTFSRYLQAELTLTDARTALVRAEAALQVAEALVHWAGASTLVRTENDHRSSPDDHGAS
jgi:outer membrane protein TolC